jgi:hypothetical protein
MTASCTQGFNISNKQMSKETIQLQPPPKERFLSVEEKVKYIIENGKKKADVCQEFGLINSTVKIMWKTRDKTFSAFEQNRSQIK